MKGFKTVPLNTYERLTTIVQLNPDDALPSLLERTTSMYALEMKQVSKRYSSSKKQTTIALNNVDLTLNESEFLGIMVRQAAVKPLC